MPDLFSMCPISLGRGHIPAFRHDEQLQQNHDWRLKIPTKNRFPLLSVSVIDLSSDGPLPGIPEDPDLAPPAPPLAPREPITLREGSIWLEGDVLMCACPDCHAPMSIRLWLMVADCWKCGTGIELSEQQEREARRLLDRPAK